MRFDGARVLQSAEARIETPGMVITIHVSFERRVNDSIGESSVNGCQKVSMTIMGRGFWCTASVSASACVHGQSTVNPHNVHKYQHNIHK